MSWKWIVVADKAVGDVALQGRLASEVWLLGWLSGLSSVKRLMHPFTATIKQKNYTCCLCPAYLCSFANLLPFDRYISGLQSLFLTGSQATLAFLSWITSLSLVNTISFLDGILRWYRLSYTLDDWLKGKGENYYVGLLSLGLRYQQVQGRGSIILVIKRQ